MALTQVTGPYPIFTDLDGTPLDDGYLYIGAINDDPETNPIQVFFDSNLTIPATQPIRTSNGYAYRNGTPALLYTGGEFSITIRNKRNEFVLYSPVGYGFDPAAVSASVVKNDFIGNGVQVAFVLSASPSTILATNIFINGVYQEKDSYTLAGNTITFSIAPPLSSSIEILTNETGVINSGNANDISYTLTAPGATLQSVQTKLEQYISVKDFGAVGDGVADDSTAINNALANGGYIYFPAGTYKVTTIVCDSVNKLTVDASAATFTSVYGNLVVINNCDDFTWTGGIFNAGTGANPAYTALGVPYTIPCNFTVFSSNRVNVSKTQINNSLTNAYPSLTAWIVGQGVFDGNQIVNGGDNSLWFFGCFHMVASNNLILNQLAGRGICFQQVNYGAITGNVAEGGKGEAYNVHGSSNIAITGNSVSDLATDAVVLGFSSGIGVEWEENATAPAIAAAIADPLLYNNVFSRNITISGNTISGTDFGIRIGNNLGISGDNYGNQGQVVIDGNNIFFVDTGINTGTSRQVRISNNMISTCAQACVELNMGTDTGGFSGEYVYIANNRFTLFNGNNSSYNAVQFQNGLPVPADNISLTNNEWDTGQFSAGFSNLSGSALACIEDGNVYANGVVSSATKAGLGIQRQFSDQTGASFLSPYLVNKASNEFTQSGAVGDSFTTVFAIPTDASIAAQIQIGISDRVVCFGTIYAHNGTPPALTFTGTGSTYVQLSGGNLQIKGNTSGGSAAYGGLYSIRYSLLNPT
jgi:hypothetical protein